MDGHIAHVGHLRLSARKCELRLSAAALDRKHIHFPFEMFLHSNLWLLETIFDWLIPLGTRPADRNSIFA